MGDLRLQTAVPILRTNRAILTTARYTLMEEVYPMTAENLLKKVQKLYNRAKEQGLFNIDGWGLYEPTYRVSKEKVINTVKKNIDEENIKLRSMTMKSALNQWLKVAHDMPIFYIS